MELGAAPWSSWCSVRSFVPAIGGRRMRHPEHREALTRRRRGRLLRAGGPDARVLADYGWGGYVIYRLHATGGRVFVDGRNDMYAQQILEDYDAIRNADADWKALVSSYGVNAILLKPDAALTRGPALDGGWCEAFRNDTQVLYLPACP